MIEETAVVVDVGEQRLLLETQRKSVCQSCSVKSGCGTSTLAKVVGKRSAQFSVDKTLNVKVGDTVVVGMDENALVQGSLLIYFLPLMVMMLVGVLAEYAFANEPITILSVIGGFVVAMIMVRFIFLNSHLKSTVQPHLIRQI